MSDDIFKKFQLQNATLQRAMQALEPLQSFLAEQERFARIYDPHRRLIEKVTKTNCLLDDAFGRNGIADLVAQTTPIPPDTAVRFWKPDLGAITALQKRLKQYGIFEALNRYQMEADVVRRAMAEMKSPWLDLQNQLSSISALTKLHGMGHILATLPSFDDHVTAALRIDLGDWRGQLALDPSALLDSVARSDFYIARGFNPSLTAFLPPAFRNGLESAGLYHVPDHADVEAENDDTDTAFMRTNEAHDRLMRFEYRLRLFINEKMTVAIGQNWIKHRVPEPMRTAWEDKKNRGLAAGEAEQPLIAYADFTDYVTIIIRKDNWHDVFAVVFEHKLSVEESFRRLYPVRICTMHARPITQDDALFLLVEIKRLSKAMGFDI